MTARLPGVVALTFLTLTLALIGAMLLLQPRNGLNAAQTLGASAVPLAFALTGAVIASRRPRNGIGWLFCVFALGIPTEEVVTARLEAPGELGPAEVWVPWISYWLWAPTLTALVTYLPLTFPHGRVVGRAARAVLALAATGAAMVVIGNALDPDVFEGIEGVQRNPAALHGHAALLEALTMIGVLPVAIAVAGSATAVVRRFRRSTGVLRQQLKWFLFAMAVAIVAVIVNGVLYETGNTGAGQVAFASGLVWLPIALGVAIFRHHLYDIDRIVSRTVAYAVLTVLLVGIYLAAVTALTALTSPVTGDSPIAVAAATLLAAAAFQPARRRIQSVVDRRFNRARYNARRTVETFATSLRQEVDLDDVRAHLVETVGDVLEPTDVRVWLTPQVVQR